MYQVGKKMDFTQIKQLIKLVEESGISSFSIEEDNVKVEINKNGSKLRNIRSNRHI